MLCQSASQRKEKCLFWLIELNTAYISLSPRSGLLFRIVRKHGAYSGFHCNWQSLCWTWKIRVNIELSHASCGKSSLKFPTLTLDWLIFHKLQTGILTLILASYRRYFWNYSDTNYAGMTRGNKTQIYLSEMKSTMVVEQLGSEIHQHKHFRSLAK